MMAFSRQGARVFGASIFFAVWAWVGCAHVEAPPGGPPDKIPPYVAGVFPQPGQTQVPRDVAIQIQFSEWIKAEGLQQRIVLNPALPGKLRVEAQGEGLLIRSDSLLRANTTYRLVLPAQIKDMAGLGMDSAFNLIFSTGPALDSGVIAGRVFATDATKLNTVWVALYLEAREQALPRRGQKKKLPWPDSSANPWREKPTVLSLCDSSGAFRLTGLAPGRYGLLAFVDANQNQLPDNGEAMGIGSSAIRVQGSEAPWQSLKLSSQDTMALKLAKATWVAAANLDSGHVAGAVKVNFSRQPAWPRSTQIAAYSVTAGETGEEMHPKSIGLSPEGDVELWFPRLPRSARLTLRVRGLIDEAGRGLDTARASQGFETQPRSDSLPNQFTLWASNAQNGRPQAISKDTTSPGETLLLRGSLPLSDSAFTALQTDLSVRADSLVLPVTLSRQGPYALSLTWKAWPATAKALYVGQASKSPLPTDTSRPAPKVSPIGRVNWLEKDQGGAVKITLGPRYQGWTAWMSRKGSLDTRVQRLPTAENRVESLLPGVWRLWLWGDQDGDGAWHPGRLHPWQSQEPAIAWPDTVLIKAGEEAGPIRLDGP